MIPLTQKVHHSLEARFRGQSHLRAIDATVGNGHDTLFLAQLVGKTGQIWGFDIQATAIERTVDRLRQAGAFPGSSEAAPSSVVLHQASHAEMLDKLPLEHFGSTIDIILFNLGYLPGGDKTLITRTDATLQALAASLPLLAPGGVLSVLAYPGHVGGEAETQAVQDWFQRLPPDEFRNIPKLRVVSSSELDRSNRSPRWLECQRHGEH
ncbi:MAG: methyltransferase domain-containing protein [Planctomycetota bacterium]|nr:MAG: methyltransferase domain-containing protein [Planctomycetota bacterium]